MFEFLINVWTTLQYIVVTTHGAVVSATAASVTLDAAVTVGAVTLACYALYKLGWRGFGQPWES